VAPSITDKVFSTSSSVALLNNTAAPKGPAAPMVSPALPVIANRPL
jgi:hypothetical protein